MLSLQRPLAKWLLSPKTFFKNRQYRYNSNLSISKEVSSALKNGLPVVALESTIITHGMPYRKNFEMALHVENVVREAGAVPATIAILNGKCHVGLDEAELETLAQNGHSCSKVSRRDLAYSMSQKLNGGTTVASTMILAERAGIDVFATGGIGGVHRGAESSMDVSADLIELGKTRVAVVCAGAKSILDIGRTLEVLETQGVPVITLGKKNTPFPAFYANNSPYKSPMTLPSENDIADLLFKGMSLGLRNGTLIAVPTPSHLAQDYNEIEKVIQLAINECEALGISGKDVTPWMLQKVLDLTKGKSLETNIGLVYNNARVAANIAVSLANLKQEAHSFPAAMRIPIVKLSEKGTKKQQKSPEPQNSNEIVCLGSVSLDTNATLLSVSKDDLVLGTSHPSSTTEAIGGVAHNIARAASLVDANVKLVSCIGDDVQGHQIANLLNSENLQFKLVQKQNSKSCCYTAINDREGSLILAAADMRIIEDMTYSDIHDDIQAAKIICMDGNISESLISDVVKNKKENQLLCYEPTSVPKSLKILPSLQSGNIDIITPNLLELDAIYSAVEKTSLFDTDSWWSRLNMFGITSDFSEKLSNYVTKLGLPNLTNHGTIQKCIKLLPFLPTILLKLGSSGILLFSRSAFMDLYRSPNSLVTPGNVVIKYYPTPKLITDAVNSSGTGDTFVGVCLSLLMKNVRVDKAIQTAQEAAGLSLMSHSCVNPEIASLTYE
ncbi:carbohydrate kinase [Schizosaccharomyces japonicus yFS275]|uniref:Carbohydrate kinase n=1 Tax=Schizosaccharomyces japonicus (strain yFS275 / FY16936) TaxID=402676 RepID=B6K3M3_SCHJY|nr:carbohydrate kinase [Schizosaccharomyces japonicus yFS275]EEB08080.1 carbohydrate kinase [Schizosaccharomyces japonicus yFS275]